MKTTAFTFLIMCSILFAACRRTVLKTNTKTDSTATRSYEIKGDWERETIREYTMLDPELDLPSVPEYLYSFLPETGASSLISSIGSIPGKVKRTGKWKITEHIREKGKVQAKEKEKTEVVKTVKTKHKQTGLDKCTWWFWVFLILIAVAMVLLYFRFRDSNKLK